MLRMLYSTLQPLSFINHCSRTYTHHTPTLAAHENYLNIITHGGLRGLRRVHAETTSTSALQLHDFHLSFNHPALRFIDSRLAACILWFKTTSQTDELLSTPQKITTSSSPTSVEHDVLVSRSTSQLYTRRSWHHGFLIRASHLITYAYGPGSEDFIS